LTLPFEWPYFIDWVDGDWKVVNGHHLVHENDFVLAAKIDNLSLR
jgi:hypothetical protein